MNAAQEKLLLQVIRQGSVAIGINDTVSTEAKDYLLVMGFVTAMIGRTSDTIRLKPPTLSGDPNRPVVNRMTRLLSTLPRGSYSK